MENCNLPELALSFMVPDLGVASMQLSEDKKVKYSPLEKRLFGQLQRTPKSTVDIAEAVYPVRDRPFNARQSVLGALNSLSKKIKQNREPFAVKKSRRQGPHPVNFWIDATR
jgi:hypothetical protein